MMVSICGCKIWFYSFLEQGVCEIVLGDEGGVGYKGFGILILGVVQFFYLSLFMLFVF